MQQIRFRQGDSFKAAAIYKSDESAAPDKSVDITEYTITATLETPDGTLAQTLPVAILDAPKGVFDIEFADTANWDKGVYNLILNRAVAGINNTFFSDDPIRVYAIVRVV